ncbi:hypothetical protein AVEN_50594-1 [Araneus ventricosus]|uniref:Uncharacterized protein n=1 Tax=Araneus ventricosus TaxID=182803 RepID=A0A4Y2AQI3_ARAVE|nr:hypothetical protein AVEN_50594-1 [Araneus ventricosus]
MAMGHFVDRRSPFPSPRFCQFSKLQNLGKRESVPNATIASSFSKGHWCGFTAAFIVGPFFFQEIGPSGTVQSVGHVMNLFCATSSFQHCNSADVWIAQFLCKMALFRTLQHQ